MADERKNALLTGSASGLGRALAIHLAREGWRIALVDVNDAANEETLRLVRSAGGDGLTYHMDVARAGEWEKLRDQLQSQWQQIDLLVNNAGVAGSGDVGSYSIEDWQWILGINLNAGIYGCHYFIPWLKQNPRGGHIINTASLAAIAARPGMAGYNVTKAGMLALSETLYGELKQHNIGVTVICPSFFQTNLLNDGRLQKIDRDMASKMMKNAGFTADDVAAEALRAMREKRLYVVLPRQGRIFWRMKRFFPNYVCNLLAKDWAKQTAAVARRAKERSTADAQPQEQKVG